MNVPIVQGTAVPYGSGGVSNNTNRNTTPYVTNNNKANYNTSYTINAEDFQPTTQASQAPRAFRDVIWAVLFLLHLVGIGGVIVMNLMTATSGQQQQGGGDDDGSSSSSSASMADMVMSGAFGGLLFLIGLLALVTIAVSTVALGLMMKFATGLVKFSLVFSIAMGAVIAVFGLMNGQMMMGIMGLGMSLIGVCYAKMVWPRIPAAAATLNTALTGVRANMGLTVVAYLMMGLALVWSLLWFVGLGEMLGSQSSSVILFLLLLSYYWVHQVLTNTVHVTTAGTIGTWWYVPHEANSCCSRAISDSFCRATTYSFGSICLGSLIVAVVQALRAVSRMSRDNEDMKMVTCIIDCILAMIESIIEFLNKYAYVYVALQGFGFIDAGKAVFELFQSKGWDVIISDDLCDRVLLTVSLGIGCVTGLIGALLTTADPNLLAFLQLEEGVAVVGFIVGLVVGFVFSSILMSIVSSAVATVIVCFAESPAEFDANHPQLSAEMRGAWQNAWPNVPVN